MPLFSMCLNDSSVDDPNLLEKTSVELRIVSRSDSGRLLHREALTMRGEGLAGLIPSQLQLLSHADCLSADDVLPVLIITGPLVGVSACYCVFPKFILRFFTHTHTRAHAHEQINLLFILQDVLCISPRSILEHLEWLVAAGDVAEAAAVAQANSSSLSLKHVTDLYNKFIGNLLEQGKADQVLLRR